MADQEDSKVWRQIDRDLMINPMSNRRVSRKRLALNLSMSRLRLRFGSAGETALCQTALIVKDETEIIFKIRRTTPMKKLIDAFCQKQVMQHRSMFSINCQ